jgi:membrane protein EpsK
MRLVIAPLSLALAATPLIYVLMATNAVRVPALWTVGLGVVDVLLIFLFTGRLGWNLYGIALASLTTLLAKHAIFLPCYVSTQLRQPVRRFLPALLTATLMTGLTGALSCLLASVVVISTWLRLGLVALATSVLFCAVVYAGLLHPGERIFVRVVAAKVLLRGAPESV